MAPLLLVASWLRILEVVTAGETGDAGHLALFEHYINDFLTRRHGGVTWSLSIGRPVRWQ